MKTRDISVGAFVEIEANGSTSRLYISEIKDGRVIFRRHKTNKRGGWWLPYEIVRERGKLLVAGEAGSRPGEREARGNF